jgi:isoleucyl-tRNA synthetase
MHAGKANMVIWTTTPWTLRRTSPSPSRPDRYSSSWRRDGWAENFIVAKPLLESFIAETGLILMKQTGELRGEDLAGNEAQHPFLDRTSRIITQTSSPWTPHGQVHIAPATAGRLHRGMQNKLPVLSPVDDRGRLLKMLDSQWVGNTSSMPTLKSSPSAREGRVAGGA